jgi:hypothetical protein
MMFFKKAKLPEVTLPPGHFPPDFLILWNEVADVQAIRREMATLLLADLRESGPEWPTERYSCLHRLINDLEKQP